MGGRVGALRGHRADDDLDLAALPRLDKATPAGEPGSCLLVTNLFNRAEPDTFLALLSDWRRRWQRRD
jgi:hypothetical protein